MRQLPNVVITGTPGVGKTTHCESLATRLDLRHISVNQVVKDENCHEGWSDEYQSWIVDEDKVSIPSFCKYPWSHAYVLPQLLDAIEDEVKTGGCLIDWHACEVFPESWIDLVVVLRVDSSTLYDRLKARYVTWRHQAGRQPFIPLYHRIVA